MQRPAKGRNAHGSLLSRFLVIACFVLAQGWAHAQDDASDEVAAGEDVEEVVVTGSYIKRKNQADLSSPLDTVGLEDIEASGWTDLEDVAETFTFNTSSWGRSGLNSGCCGTARGIEIRALGSSSTLVLQNGKRVASTRTGRHGADMTNIKALMPVIAVDRIETLLDGGAALYGSDAVAGVVNIIPRRNFEGFEARIGSKAIDGSGQWESQFIVGTGNDFIRGMFAVSFEHTDHLLQRERPFTLINNTSGNGTPGSYNLRVFDADLGAVNPAWRPLADDGGDLIIDNGFHGPVNYSSIWDDFAAMDAPPASFRVADPYCRPGIVPDFPGGRGANGESNVTIPGGGQFTGDEFPLGTCRFTYQPSNSIAPQENTALMYSLWEITLSDTADLTLEYSGQRRNSWTEFIATFPMTQGKPVVPAQSPYNPFNVDAIWTGRPMGNAYPPVRVSGEGIAERYSVTLTGDFAEFLSGSWAETWSYSLSAQYSHHHTDGEAPDSDLRMVQYALDGFGGPACNVRFDGPHPSEQAGVGNCYYFSPFGANIYRNTFDPNSGYGAVGGVDPNGNLVLAGAQETMDVLNYSIQTESKSYSNRSLMILEGVVTGDLFELPGGAAGLALGVQNRRHSRGVFITNFRQGFWQGFLDPSIGGRGSRQVEAMFGEVWLPIHDQVEVQVAVRREAYNPGLANTDPKVGVRYAMSDWLSLRASYGTSFRAPSLGQVVGNDTDAYVTEIADPLDPAEFDTGTGTFRTILVSKNPDLEPEESTSYNFGFSLTPEVPWGDGDHSFQVDVDWFSLTFENQVRAENPNQVVRDDPCGAQVQRDPTNAIQNPLLQNVGASACPNNVGNVLIVETGFFNSGQTEVSGADIGAQYSFSVGDNAFAVRSETSYIHLFEIQVSDEGGIVDGAGARNKRNPASAVPQIRSNLFLNWQNGPQAGNLTFRYIDGMDDDWWGGMTKVAAHTEIDVQYSYTFGEGDRYTASVGAINLFDKETPFARFDGWEPTVHNPYMRQLYARLNIML